MSETMSNVERGLWRIAELGARCSQQAAAGSRGRLWAELEQTIAGLEADFEAAGQAVDIAPSQVRNLEGRLNVAKKERDRERARAQECFADAQAARRERDRERARAAKAVAAATQAKATAAECIAQATAAQAALDQALSAREEVIGGLDEAVNARDRAMSALDDAKARIAMLEADREGLRAELETARAAFQAVRADLETARGDLETAGGDLKTAGVDLKTAGVDLETTRGALETVRAERDALAAGRVEALDAMAARAEGAVVVLPGVDLPGAEVGPVAPARVSWRPAWSEWAGDDDVSAEPMAPEAAPRVPSPEDVADERSADLVLDDMDEVGVRRYLNVAATIGQLLPDDLAPLLLSGATVVRREGRLFATVAVTANPWAEPGSDGAEQARKLADAGFRVEWTTDAPLAC